MSRRGLRGVGCHCRRTRLLLTVIVAAVCCSLAARADVGLVVETPTGLLGFLSDVGHASVWLSRGCLDATGHIGFCEHTSGLVLTSPSYWPNPGAAAIPAALFFLGESSVAGGGPAATWETTMASTYPNVPAEQGRKYLGRAWLRSIRVVRFSTTAAEDRTALAQLEAERQGFHYSYAHRNCAFYAQAVLQHYMGASFHGNRVLEFGMLTPRSVERALKRNLKQQGTPFQTVAFRGRFWHSWREPPRNICEAAVLDPKYAIPMLIYQPYLYAGFAGCYGLIRVLAITNSVPSESFLPGAVTGKAASREQDTREAYRQLVEDSDKASSEQLAASN